MESLYKVNNIPVFQNKVYGSEQEAKQAQTGTVELFEAPDSGLVFNKAFNPKLMVYDENYQNEQNHSQAFQSYLKNIIQKLRSLGIANKKIVEIGCGKGYFLEMLREEGMDVIGFDPTFEGEKPYIIKSYFSQETAIDADFILMRHTMEHIPDPFNFLKTIAQANGYKGDVFIEVPTLDWIVDKNAFWDIFYEHCNYFTERSFASFFEQAETGRLFNGQYMYIHASLSQLRVHPQRKSENLVDLQTQQLAQKLAHWEKFIEKHPGIVVWGAGAKGSTFLNLVDPQKKYVPYVVDINPAKQNRFIAGTGHPIKAADFLLKNPPKNILVMNENYLPEIKKTVNNPDLTFYNL